MVQCMLNPSVLCFQINSWSGSVEIGVTACDPDCLEFPSSATDLRGGSWVRLSLLIAIRGLSKMYPTLGREKKVVYLGGYNT